MNALGFGRKEKHLLLFVFWVDDHTQTHEQPLFARQFTFDQSQVNLGPTTRIWALRCCCCCFPNEIRLRVQIGSFVRRRVNNDTPTTTDATLSEEHTSSWRSIELHCCYYYYDLISALLHQIGLSCNLQLHYNEFCGKFS